MKRIIRTILITLSAFQLFSFSAFSASVITARITITNHANITGTNAELLRITNVTTAYTRTWTNSVADPTTQILVGTNIATDVQSLAVQLATYPISGLSVGTDLSTWVSLRGTNDALVRVGLSPTNYGYVTYSTQTVGTATGLRVPYTVESETTKTNHASGVNLMLDADGYNTNKFLNNFALMNVGRLGLNAASVTVSNAPNYLALAASNVVLRMVGAATPIVAGISNGFAGRLIALVATTNTITITNENTLIAATNRILTPGGALTVITNYGFAFLFYDGATNRWILAPAGSGGGGGAGSGSGLALVGKSVWVDATVGNDSTATRTNPALPFATLERAKTNAVAGDTIYVWQGVYNPAQTLLKSNVNWHFFNGTIVTNTGSAEALFDDLNAANGVGDVTVTGDAEFYDSGSYGVYALQKSGSNVRIECKKIKSHGNTIPIYQAGGTTVIHAKDAMENTTSGAQGVVYIDGGTTGGGSITINHSRIINNRTNANSAAVYFGSATVANTNTTLRDCVIVCQPLVTNTITGYSGSAVRIYGTLMATPTTNYSTVSILTGATRFEIGDVK